MSLKLQSLLAVRSAGTAAIFANLLQLLQLIILARLLTPSDFGLVGMVNVAISLLLLLADLGLGSAVIQKAELDQRTLSSLYWVNVLIAVALFILAVLARHLMAAFFHEPRLSALFIPSAAVFLIAAFGQQQAALLERALQFRRLGMIEVFSTFAGVCVAIGSAAAGLGVLSFIYGMLVAASIRVVCLFSMGGAVWRPSFHLEFVNLGSFLRFGLNHAGQRMVNYVTGNIDFLLVGRFLGATDLGFYSLAYNLANLPSARLNPPLLRVFFPVLSRVQNDRERLKGIYLRIQEASSMVNVPLLVGLAVVAPRAVHHLFGPEWSSAGRLIQVLVVVGLARALAGTVGPLLLATGRTDLGFRWSVLIVALQVPAIYAGVRTGSVMGVAIAFAVMSIVIFLLNYLVLLRSLLGPLLREYAASMWPALWMSAVMGILVWGTGYLLPGAPSLVTFLVQIAAGILVYGILVARFAPGFLRNLGGFFSAKETAGAANA